MVVLSSVRSRKAPGRQAADSVRLPDEPLTDPIPEIQEGKTTDKDELCSDPSGSEPG